VIRVAEIHGNYQWKIRRENLKRIIRFIHRKGVTSRTAISQELNLSPSAVTNLIASLIETGLVQENGFGQSLGGRRPTLLKFNKEWGWVIAVKIGVQRIHAGLANLNGELKAKKVFPLHSHDPEEVIHQTTELVASLLAEHPHRNNIIGVGVCCPGIINAESGEVVKAVNLGWEGVPLKDMLSAHFPWPVFVENVTDAGALGEKWFGSGKDADNLLYVNVGNGIGVGIISHGELYTGYQHAAGEFGHMSIDFSGPPCPCGNRGCLELYASAAAIIRKANERIKSGEATILHELAIKQERKITCELLSEAAYLGDSLALCIWQETGEILGQAIANLVNLFDPEVVVIGGGLSLAHPTFFETIAQVIRRTTSFLHPKEIEIRKAFFGKDSGLIGAAALTVEKILT